MTTVLLVRHGLTDANTSGVLAGWTPGVHLAEKGREQVVGAGRAAGRGPGRRDRLQPAGALPGDAPKRCWPGGTRSTSRPTTGWGSAATASGRANRSRRSPRTRCGRSSRPTRARSRFPGGEALRETQARAVEAVRAHNAALGDDATWIAVSHGDVIKAILADALGMHLDAFQRIQVDPASVSVVRYTELRPFVVRMNDRGGAVSDLIPPKKRSRRRKASSDAAVGGGAGRWRV